MNKKKKSGIRWLLVIVLLLVTLFAGSMVACGLIKEKLHNKAQEDVAEESGEEESIDETASDIGSEAIALDNESGIDFDLSMLPDTLEPQGLCVYGDTLYISDAYSKSVFMVTAAGAEVFAGAESDKDAYDKPQGGYSDDEAKNALFGLPWGIAPYGDGIAIADTENGVIRIVSDGRVDTIKNSDGDPDSFEYPTGIASDDSGNLFVSDTHANAVMTIFPNGEQVTLLDNLNSPMGLCYMAGYLYITETGVNRVIRVNAADPTTPKSQSDIEIVAGSGSEGGTDGEAAFSSFSSPKGITVGSDGTVYVADTVNGAVRVISGGQVSTLDVKDVKVPEAELVSPTGICIYGGRLYIADSFGRKIYVVE